MLSKYIKNLLDIHSRVIVPDLGAFMLKGDASKTIYFNEFLRFNDGLLVDYIGEQEQIDKIEAAKKVKLFVDNVNKQLSGNKSVALEGIGILYLDINEKIQLKTSDDAPAQPVKQPESETEASPREILFELENTEPEPAQKTSTPPPPVAPAPKSKPETQAQGVKEAKSGTIQPAASAAKEEKKQPAPKEEVIEVAPTNTWRMILVGIFGALVIAAIVYFAFFRSGKKEHNINQNITIGTDVKKDSMESAKDTSIKATQKTVAKKPGAKVPAESKKKETTKPQPAAKVTESKPKPAVPATGKKFYIIAGTFSVEANADRMVKKLKDEGYTSGKIRNNARNVFYVSYASFGDRQAAQEEMKKLKSSGKTDAWLYAD
jgi:cell division septation protein DedD